MYIYIKSRNTIILPDGSMYTQAPTNSCTIIYDSYLYDNYIIIKETDSIYRAMAMLDEIWLKITMAYPNLCMEV